MMRCERCGASSVSDVALGAERCIEVAGHRFTATLPAFRCEACGQPRVSASVLQRFELLAARSLADAGASSGEAFAFMRRALGLPAERLAPLLDIRPIDLARWDKADFVYRSAVEIVAGLIRRKLDGDDSRALEPRAAENLLMAYHSPRPLPKYVRFDIRAEQLARITA
jgi:hypothetical protein